MELVDLKQKAAFSNVVAQDQVKKFYKGLAIVESERGFTSEAEIDEYIKASLAEKTK